MTTHAPRIAASATTTPKSRPVLRSDEALARVQLFLKDARMPTTTSGSFADFERKLHERVMEFERELLAEEMSRADIDAEAIVVDGITYRRVVRCQGTYFTSAGPVGVERTLFKDRTDESGLSVAAMDLRLGIVDGRWTPIAAQQVAWVVAQMTPYIAAELFQRIGNMTP